MYRGTKKELKPGGTRWVNYECLFRLHDYLLKLNEWSLSIVNGAHNHLIELKLNGHFLANGINVEENGIVEDVSRNMTQPTNISMAFKDKRKDNVTIIKQDYDVHQRYKKYIRTEMLEIQHLLKC